MILKVISTYRITSINMVEATFEPRLPMRMAKGSVGEAAEEAVVAVEGIIIDSILQKGIPVRSNVLYATKRAIMLEIAQTERLPSTLYVLKLNKEAQGPRIWHIRGRRALFRASSGCECRLAAEGIVI
jgi:hypothetical protein